MANPDDKGQAEPVAEPTNEVAEPEPTKPIAEQAEPKKAKRSHKAKEAVTA